MSLGIYTIDTRISFIELSGTEGTDYGYSTAYPLEIIDDVISGRAKTDILAELYYRVRDARCISGAVTTRENYGGGSDYYESITTFTTATPQADLYQSEIDDTSPAQSIRGYCTSTPQTSPNIPMIDFGANVFDNSYYYTTYFGDSAARDAASELALWANNGTGVGKLDTYLPDVLIESILPNDFRTGFSYSGGTFIEIDSNTLQSKYYPYTTIYDSGGGGSHIPYYSGAISLEFDGNVGWVNVDGSRNPLSAGNRIFAGVNFTLKSTKSVADAHIGSNAGVMFSPTSTGSNATLRLAGGVDLSFPLYVEGTVGVVTIYDISDFVFAATEWWAYQDGGGDVWDTATGLLLP